SFFTDLGRVERVRHRRLLLPAECRQEPHRPRRCACLENRGFDQALFKESEAAGTGLGGARQSSDRLKSGHRLAEVGNYCCLTANCGRRLSIMRSADVPGGKNPRYFPSRPTRKTKPEWSITGADFFDRSSLAK